MRGSKKETSEKREILRPYSEAVAAMSRQFEAKVRELSTIRRISDALADPLEMETVCEKILDAVMEGMEAETGILILFGTTSRNPVVEVFAPADAAGCDRFHPSHEMIDRVLKERTPLLIQDLSAALQFTPRKLLPGSGIVLPLVSREVEIGIIGLGHSDASAFRPQQVPAAHIVGSQAAIGLENLKLLHDLIAMNESLEEKVLERTRRLQETTQRLLELQDQLIQAEKMKVIGQFTAGIGHNLRTPLSVILSTADLIQFHGDGNGKIFKYAEKIAQQGKRMGEIIENLMEKCQKSQQQGCERLNMNDILRKELSFMESNLDFKHNVIKEYSFEERLPEITGRYGDFSQTFVNLINNAVDATHDNKLKQLKIVTSYDSNHVYVHVQDNGCGIPESDIGRIFDFSFTTKGLNRTQGSPAGLGIGLFNSKHLMGKYGAEITVVSQPGETVFTVKIPQNIETVPEAA